MLSFCRILFYYILQMMEVQQYEKNKSFNIINIICSRVDALRMLGVILGQQS